MARVYPLFSGSKGNSYYISQAGRGILIDAGRSAKQIELAMANNELNMKDVEGIFITHEHSDHVSGVRVLASRYGINVYGSKGTLEALDENGVLTEKFSSYVIGTGGVETAGMHITPFSISHDCREGFGYVVETNESRKLVLATDTGCVTDQMQDAIITGDVVILESNHDVNMLLNGIYPYVLKRRILSDTGHLSNEVCSTLLPSLVKSGATRFLLAHLSQENNMPSIALQSALCELESSGMQRNVDFTLEVAKSETDGSSIVF